MQRSTTALALVALLAAACSDIDTARNSSGILVATYGAPGALAGATSFAIVGRPALVTGTPGASGVTLADAPGLIAAVSAAIEAQGLAAVGTVDPASPPPSPPPADVAVNVSELGPARPAPVDFWAASAEHLGPATFGLSGSSWSYAWGWVPISVKGGSVLVEVVDLRSAPASGPVPVSWTLIAHAASATDVFDTPGMAEAIRRGFAQLPITGARSGVR